MPTRIGSHVTVIAALAVVWTGCVGDGPNGGVNPEAACLSAGGAVVTRSCCISAPDFPSTCLPGVCGCSSGNSAPRKLCECPAGQCFDGSRCASAAEAGCVASGGTVASAPCCALAADMPNSCLVGACGCSPEQSVVRKLCSCPTGACFDGAACVSR